MIVTMESWEDLIDYLFPRPAGIVPTNKSSSTKTALYTAKDKPAPQYAPHTVILDRSGPESILSRAKDALRTGLAQHPATSRLPNVDTNIETALEALEIITKEAECAFAWKDVANIATSLVKAIFAGSGLKARCNVTTPERTYLFTARRCEL